MSSSRSESRSANRSWFRRVGTWLAGSQADEPKPQPRSFAPQVQELEGRSLMATITNLAGTVTIVGTHLNDTAAVMANDTRVVVGAKSGNGANLIKAFNRSDVRDVVFQGGDGNDVFLNVGRLPSRAYGSNGHDFLIGGTGADRLYAGAGNDIVSGRWGNDSITGDAGNDRLYGDDGADTIRGGSGADTIDGGLGNDVLYGDADRDLLFGNWGVDLLVGGTGNDLLDGGYGYDALYGQGGNDLMFDDSAYLLGHDFNIWSDGFRNGHLFLGTAPDAVMAYFQVGLTLTSVQPTATYRTTSSLIAGYNRYLEDNPGSRNFYAATASNNITALLGTNQGSIYSWGPNKLGDGAGRAAYLGAGATAAAYTRSLNSRGFPELASMVDKYSFYTSTDKVRALQFVGLM